MMRKLMQCELDSVPNPVRQRAVKLRARQRGKAIPSCHGTPALCERLLLVVLMFVSGCSPKADFSSAKDACVLFHRRVDRSDYGSVYDAAAGGFRTNQNRELFVGFLRRVARKLGKCDDATISLSGFRAPFSSTFVMTAATRTCANGQLQEQFVWQMVRGEARLARYNASSPLLLTD